jgi:hypothetical protein
VQEDHLDEALQRAREAARLMRRAGLLGSFLDHFAMLAFKLGRSTDAARALGRAEAYFERQPMVRQPNEQRVRDQLLIELRRALAEEELTRYLAEGAAMSDVDATRAAVGE